MASTLSVPMIPFASFVQAYWDSFVNRDPPMNAIQFGEVALIAFEVMSSAVFQEEATSPSALLSGLFKPDPRTRGSCILYSLWNAWNENLSLSVSHPQLTSSLSSP